MACDVDKEEEGVLPREFLLQLARIWSIEFDTEGKFRFRHLFEYRFIQF